MRSSFFQSKFKKIVNCVITVFCLSLALGVMPQSIVKAESTSSTLYFEVEKSVYQIRVINRSTGKKVSIGSGFVISREDILATNYHVISSYVNAPDIYELDYISTSGESGALELVDVDVIHDLALLRTPKGNPLGMPLQLGTVPKKGANLYALGNPLDLGFSIVPGTNNGVLQYSEANNIFFSGSLNAGMSGGPTLDEDTKVVGVNVATSGNEISFLVPSRYLGALLDRAKLRGFNPIDDVIGQVSQQLRDDSRSQMKKILKNAGKWSMADMGQFAVPSETLRSMRCWDASNEEEVDPTLSNLFTQCSNERNIYVAEGLEFGLFQYQYDWYEADNLWAAHFYHLYEDKAKIELINSNIDINEVTEFECHTGFVDVATKDFKVTVCRRDYVNYAGLSDMVVTGAMVSEKNRGFIFNFDAIGTDFESALKAFGEMLRSFEWRN